MDKEQFINSIIEIMEDCDSNESVDRVLNKMIFLVSKVAEMRKIQLTLCIERQKGKEIG